MRRLPELWSDPDVRMNEGGCDPAGSFHFVHCVSEEQATLVAKAISGRMEQVGLRLHPGKTRIVCAPRAQEGEVEM